MTKVNADQYYASQMARLEADHKAGIVSDGQYEMYKAQIIANATRPPRGNWWRTILIIAVVLIGCLIALRIITAIANSI